MAASAWPPLQPAQSAAARAETTIDGRARRARHAGVKIYLCVALANLKCSHRVRLFHSPPPQEGCQLEKLGVANWQI